jgi:hypothetical protein
MLFDFDTRELLSEGGTRYSAHSASRAIGGPWLALGRCEPRARTFAEGRGSRIGVRILAKGRTGGAC